MRRNLGITAQFARVQVPVTVEPGRLILQHAIRYPADPALVKAIRGLTDSMMLHVPAKAVPSFRNRRRGLPGDVHRNSWSAEDLSIMICVRKARGLHSAILVLTFELLQGLVHFNLHDRAMMTAEHFSLRGWHPSARSMSSVRVHDAGPFRLRLLTRNIAAVSRRCLGTSEDRQVGCST
jgi:hypothetical protein